MKLEVDCASGSTMVSHIALLTGGTSVLLLVPLSFRQAGHPSSWQSQGNFPWQSWKL